MNIIIRIWLLITCFALGLFYANSLLVKQALREKYPNAVFKKFSLLGFLKTFIESVLMCACPIIHLLVIYVSISNYEDILNRVLRRVEDDINKEKKNEDI